MKTRYIFAGPDRQGLPAMSFQEEVKAMWRLLSGFGLAARRFKSQKTRHCLELLRSGRSNTSELCNNCQAFFACQQTEGVTRLVRCSLPFCGLLPQELPSQVQPLWAVRVLDLGSLRCLEPSALEVLVAAFPHLRVLRVEDEEDFESNPDAARSWWTTLRGLEVNVATPRPPSWLCELKGLTRLHIHAGDSGSITALPPCLGDLSSLIHLNVVGNNLTGSASLPSELGRLGKELLVFEAFQNGRYREREEGVDPCPDDQVPQREGCLPGYVARADGAPPAWRCPAAGWNIRLEDRSLPWWQWRKIEKMHIDANFIYGGIPDDIPTLWPRLRSLDLHDLRLSGVLPRSLTKLQNLTQLQVQLNDLECAEDEDVVAELFQHPKLRTLNVDANPRLCGCVPSKTRANFQAQVGETEIRVGCREAQEL